MKEKRGGREGGGERGNELEYDIKFGSMHVPSAGGSLKNEISLWGSEELSRRKWHLIFILKCYSQNSRDGQEKISHFRQREQQFESMEKWKEDYKHHLLVFFLISWGMGCLPLSNASTAQLKKSRDCRRGLLCTSVVEPCPFRGAILSWIWVYQFHALKKKIL